ncbi:hypothetical protein MPNB_0370 [Mycoplasmoides pneumoniae]|uniref:Uncharacterized protein n=1 Tax=Mycoplasmoides pneumoniae 309 TaxID=1112856 RepID=A0AB33HLD3_MYCPM|nr:hypothetical protein MPNA0370 [Mycoplasmoides pneumoniae 309]BAV19504.1 hypothetical protein MPNB_0370 [Mycoplasmoides pneumoniae]BAV20239.1 hypothetical protein MPNC_0370 [Mycoplasmoides pneumoniae]
MPSSAFKINLSVSPWFFCSTWSSLICWPWTITTSVSRSTLSSTTWILWPWLFNSVSIFVSRWSFDFLYSLNSLRVTYSVFTGITGLLSLNCLLKLPENSTLLLSLSIIYQPEKVPFWSFSPCHEILFRYKTEFSLSLSHTSFLFSEI